MMKITDAEYRLPYIEALSAFDVMETGTTQPMAIWGADTTTGERGKFVVKFVGSSRMSVKSSCRELLGCWMAKELEIPVVEPVIVNISEAFVSTTLGQKGYQSALKSIGFNFGSMYEEGFSEFPQNNFKLSNALTEKAKMIFMFDMFIGNADRGAGKPNVLSNGESLLILDHELAFSFADILSFLRNKTPWILGPAEKEMYTTHYLYPFLNKQEINFEPFTEKLVVFNDAFWSKALSLIPEGWNTGELSDIKAYLDSIIVNRISFSGSLTKIVAP
jgi:hypothetical protein